MFHVQCFEPHTCIVIDKFGALELYLLLLITKASLFIFIVHEPAINPPPPHHHHHHPGDFWRQWVFFLIDEYIYIYVISVFACLQDEMLCFQRLSDMVHSSLITCIKMDVYISNPKQLAAITLFGNTKMLHMLVWMGSATLVAEVVLPGKVA